MRWVYTILILLAGLFVLTLSVGAVPEGTVTEILGSKGSNSRFYSYTFPVDGRVQAATRRDIPWSARDTPIGSKVVVRYDPQDPSKNMTRAELDESESWGNRIVF